MAVGEGEEEVDVVVAEEEEVDALGATDDGEAEASIAKAPLLSSPVSSFSFASLGSARLRSRAAAAAEASSRSVVEPGRVATRVATILRRDTTSTTTLLRATTLLFDGALAGAAAFRSVTPCLLTVPKVDLMSDSRGGRLVCRDGAGSGTDVGNELMFLRFF